MRVVCTVVGVVLAALLLVGCGDEGPSASTPADAPPRTQRSDDPAAERPASGDRGLARAALVRLDDLPSGWGEIPTPLPNLRCGAADPFRGAAVVVASNRLALETTGIQETVAVYRTEAASRRAYARINSRAALACLRRNVRQDMSEEAAAPASPPRLVRSGAVGRSARAMRYVADIPNAAGTMHGYIDAVHARSGRAVAGLVIVAGLEPFEEALYERVVTRMTSRLHDTLN